MHLSHSISSSGSKHDCHAVVWFILCVSPTIGHTDTNNLLLGFWTWEEVGDPRRNPNRHRQNLQGKKGRRESQPVTFMPWGPALTAAPPCRPGGNVLRLISLRLLEALRQPTSLQSSLKLAVQRLLAASISAASCSSRQGRGVTGREHVSF